MKYRSARAEDKYDVSKLIVLALDDLARKFVNSKNADDLTPVIEIFFSKKGNVYSYENTIVAEDDSGIAGSITGYDGAEFEKLRQPFIDYIRENYAFSRQIENETSGGEFYIDTLAVFQGKQGHGIGSGLIKKMINFASECGHKKIGLLVDDNNPEAKKLYTRLGFELAGEKTLLGDKYEHLVFDITK
jgi:ribosomal protein S18 acetylase RimI-like enzyme